MTLTFILDLTTAMGTVVMMLVTRVVEWRRQPYTRQEFSQAMERICGGVEELWQAQDEFMFMGAEAFAADTERLRRLCRRMLRDMLLNTCWILERTEPCCTGFLGDGPRIESRDAEVTEINRRAVEVVRRGTRLVFRLR